MSRVRCLASSVNTKTQKRILYDPVCSQLLDCLAVVPQSCQHFLGLFAEQRRRSKKLRRRTRHVDRTADEIACAHLGMVDLFGNAEVLDLRIVEHLSDRVDGRVRNLISIQALQPVFAWLSTELVAQDFDDFIME